LNTEGNNQRPPRRYVDRILAWLFVASVASAIILTVVLVVMLVRDIRENKRYEIEEESYIETPGEQQTAEVFAYGDNLLTAKNDVDKNEYDSEAFALTDGLLEYVSDDVETFAGVDVSTFQSEIDWSMVKEAGIDFAIIRAGYRGYTEGKLNQDDMLYRNLEQTTRLGIKKGIYFFSQATSEHEAREEAETVLEWIDGYDIEYPIVFDWEPVYRDDSRTNDTDGATVTECCKTFCETIENAGYKPMVYFNQYIAYYIYDLSEIKDYDFWLAEYDNCPTFYYDFEILQYTNSGIVDGIPTGVDLNISFKDYSK